MTEFIKEESDLVREEKQIIWEMFVDWYPYLKKNISIDLQEIDLSKTEKEVFELVFVLGFILSIFDSMKLLRQKQGKKTEIEMGDMPSVLQVILNHNMGYSFSSEKTTRIISFLFSSTFLGEEEFLEIFRVGAIHFTNWGKMKAKALSNISLGIDQLITKDGWLTKTQPKLKSSSFLISEIN
tara:strand:+ start:307 stop:852 length:546 start_codon:yes stop_codon:yes gene_type:complete